MVEKLRVALIVLFLVVGNVLFFLYMQANPDMCDGIGYPVCSGSADGDGTPSGGAADDMDPLKEYFLQLSSWVDEASERNATVKDEYAAALAAAQTDDDRFNALLDYIEGLASAVEVDASAAHSIDPPAGVKDAHERFAEAQTESMTIIRAMADATVGAQSRSEIEEALVELESAGAAATERVVETCVELQDIADSSGIDVYLGCAPERISPTP